MVGTWEILGWDSLWWDRMGYTVVGYHGMIFVFDGNMIENNKGFPWKHGDSRDICRFHPQVAAFETKSWFSPWLFWMVTGVFPHFGKPPYAHQKITTRWPKRQESGAVSVCAWVMSVFSSRKKIRVREVLSCKKNPHHNCCMVPKLNMYGKHMFNSM